MNDFKLDIFAYTVCVRTIAVPIPGVYMSTIDIAGAAGQRHISSMNIRNVVRGACARPGSSMDWKYRRRRAQGTKNATQTKAICHIFHSNSPANLYIEFTFFLFCSLGRPSLVLQRFHSSNENQFHFFFSSVQPQTYLSHRLSVKAVNCQTQFERQALQFCAWHGDDDDDDDRMCLVSFCWHRVK